MSDNFPLTSEQFEKLVQLIIAASNYSAASTVTKATGDLKHIEGIQRQENRYNGKLKAAKIALTGKE